MAHIETKDPFGFVGSHVVRRRPRQQGEEHGWLTRYDQALDCYTLFVPGGGEPRPLARGEVMKFLSASNIELHDDDQATFPPPVENKTSRFVGVPIRRPCQHVGEEDSSDDDNVNEDVRGHVTCFLPFAARYRVEYEDGSVDELTESALIDGMIALLTSPFFSSPSRRKTRNSLRRTRSSVDFSDEDESLSPGRRKRPRTSVSDAELIPSGSVVVVDLADDEQKEGDATVVEPTTGGQAETGAVPNILEMLSRGRGDIPGNGVERRSMLEETGEPREELILIDGGDVADQDTGLANEEKTEQSKQATGASIEPSDAEDKKKVVPFYIIDKKPHEAIRPLPKRTLAYELMRASLLNVLDLREANGVKRAMQCDLLRNPDIKDRDAVNRFVQAEGFVVLNHLLTSFAEEEEGEKSDEDDNEDGNEEGADAAKEKLQTRMQRDDELLQLLKIVAMLPMPTRNQVMDTGIGKTIGFLGKPSGPPGRDTPLPKCIRALAKWIRTKWTQHITQSEPERTPPSGRAPNRSQQQQSRRGGKNGRPSRQLNARQPVPRRQASSTTRMAPAEIPEPMDSTPIPRVNRLRQTAPPPPQQPVATATAAAAPPRRVSGGLKPDWMRQKENLSRSRFCINDNTNVDTRLYRGNRVRPITNVPVMSASQVAGAQDSRSDQSEAAGGPDGVFGRSQRLRFGKQWGRQEFKIDDPPNFVAQPSYARPQYPGPYTAPPPTSRSSRRVPPRSILRRVSKYNDEPAIEEGGNEMAGDS
ncbi:hypothetical protein BBJ28_00017002 [Nothophytophthora sp. Chile5]|nr:hypothetical protein BBJ28_00017002 [Nothophytophthora sp. Chile5]